MRQLLFVFTISAIALLAQGGGGAPKNLKVLKPEDVRAAMGMARVGLGVQCTECHAADFSSDEKPMKVTARMMFAMTQEINAKFPDGKAHVTCYTCHRGQKEPVTAPPAAQ
jgi:Photosynthetic reaction centre cytochrome C subunit